MYKVEVCIHKTKMWVGIELTPDKHIALWGPTVETNWRRGNGGGVLEHIGDGFKGVQAATVSGNMFTKAREKERKGYTRAYTFILPELFDKNPQTTAGRKFLDLITEHARDAGVDPKSLRKTPPNIPNPLSEIAEPIKGIVQDVPWA